VTKRVNEGSTHWEGCETEHHECALALLRDCRAKLADYKREVGAWRDWWDRFGRRNVSDEIWPTNYDGMTHPAPRTSIAVARAENEQREREGK
jgi:hypothetical protein